MPNLTKTTKPVKAGEINRSWHLIDVKNQILGRISSHIAKLLQGKQKASYVPYLDMGDYVVVTNARAIVLTGRKSKNKVYTRFSGYPGGLREINFQEIIKKNPTQVVRLAVSGMLPKNKLRDRRLARLFIFADDEHPYQNKFKNPKS